MNCFLQVKRENVLSPVGGIDLVIVTATCEVHLCVCVVQCNGLTHALCHNVILSFENELSTIEANEFDLPC